MTETFGTSVNSDVVGSDASDIGGKEEQQRTDASRLGHPTDAHQLVKISRSGVVSASIRAYIRPRYIRRYALM